MTRSPLVELLLRDYCHSGRPVCGGRHSDRQRVGSGGVRVTKRILVVEDEPDIRLLLRMVLEGSGHSVIEASDGDRAVARIAEERPDLVVLDVMLPGLDGWDVLAAMQSGGLAPDTPVVMLSALSSEQDQLRAWEGGASDYVAKPFTREQILQAIEGALEPVAADERERRREAMVDWLTRVRHDQDRRRRERVEVIQHRPEDPVAQLAAFVESTDDAVITLTEAGQVTSWNPDPERDVRQDFGDVCAESVEEIIGAGKRSCRADGQRLLSGRQRAAGVN
jgi:DNA-binding response OmpR family regulator